MKIAIITDSWHPLTNGVVTTLDRMVPGLTARGHQVEVFNPLLFKTVPLPTYPEIRLAVLPYRRLAAMLDAYRPDAVHIVIEGPLGVAGRAYCRRRHLPFTSSFTTRFPEDVELRTKVIPASWVYRWERWFHDAAAATTVAVPSLMAELTDRGFKNLVYWTRGVDPELFAPGPKDALDAPRPVNLYMGRIAVEKNLEAFLDLDLPGSKVLIGDGPDLPALKRRYPEAIFLGRKTGADLAAHLRAADVYVFPSTTDTFGISMLEAMACGVPVAAFDAVGPRDLVVHGKTGWLDHDLGRAVARALTMDPAACRAHALGYTWRRSLDQLESLLVPIHRRSGV